MTMDTQESLAWGLNRGSGSKETFFPFCLCFLPVANYLMCLPALVSHLFNKNDANYEHSQ